MFDMSLSPSPNKIEGRGTLDHLPTSTFQLDVSATTGCCGCFHPLGWLEPRGLP